MPTKTSINWYTKHPLIIILRRSNFRLIWGHVMSITDRSIKFTDELSGTFTIKYNRNTFTKKHKKSRIFPQKWCWSQNIIYSWIDVHQIASKIICIAVGVRVDFAECVVQISTKICRFPFTYMCPNGSV